MSMPHIKRRYRGALTVIAAVLALSACDPAATAPAPSSSPSITASVSPTPTPTPTVVQKMPNMVGRAPDQAKLLLNPYGFKSVEFQSAYTDVTIHPDPIGGTVCFQNIDEGREIPAQETITVVLHITEPRTTCPTALGTELHPKPAPETTPPPAAAPPAPTKPAYTPPAPKPPRTSAPAPDPEPAGCYPKSNAGNCYNAGQICRKADVGTSGIAGNGRRIHCRHDDSVGQRWGY
ncbi:PASTA domain-containing protein [Streptomyces sp. ISL-43]|uniref:PASTA domain-containing protein n=1 Tax=Streptomyces sp. ISL-43 TaxID=2819183 RepID=UPI001BEB58FD|nr:PASTA domain-containing protein [Streptomyces sp. ISL-43]MBT2452848.1 PASTA domain-containing protein [Streptomyces sp. ISL-43]